MLMTKSEAFDLLVAIQPLFEARLDTGKITWSNAPLETLFGYTLAGSLNDRPITDMLPNFPMGEYAVNPTPQRRMAKGLSKSGEQINLELLLFPKLVAGILVVLGLLSQVSVGEGGAT